MPDEVFRPKRPVESTNDTFTPAMEQQEGIKIQGNPPKEFLQALKQTSMETPADIPMEMPKQPQPKAFKNLNQQQRFSNDDQNGPTVVKHGEASGHLKEILEGIRGSISHYEELLLPSKGRFYDGINGPPNGIVSLRQMTGQEEQILATPQYIRKGQALDMIFTRCLKEGNEYKPSSLLSVDRTYLLLYLRGISYSQNYEVEVKCPECEKKFQNIIDLSTLFVEYCPEDFGPDLSDKLPQTGLPFRYRLSTGKDEQEITEYRERRLRQFGAGTTDDTLSFRTSMLLDDIDGITDKTELQILLKNLPICDVSHIRNCINEPPFGVDTNIEIYCPSCLQEFNIDLPLETNFFFPRKKKGENTQA